MAGRAGSANRESLRLDGNFFRFNRDGKYDQGFFNSHSWSQALREAGYAFTFGRSGGYIIRVRRETRLCYHYWYAFKTVHGKTCKVYVGKELNLEALLRAWLKMARRLDNQS